MPQNRMARSLSSQWLATLMLAAVVVVSMADTVAEPTGYRNQVKQCVSCSSPFGSSRRCSTCLEDEVVVGARRAVRQLLKLLGVQRTMLAWQCTTKTQLLLVPSQSLRSIHVQQRSSEHRSPRSLSSPSPPGSFEQGIYCWTR